MNTMEQQGGWLGLHPISPHKQIQNASFVVWKQLQVNASEAPAPEGSEQSLSTVETASTKKALPSQTAAVESSKSSGARNGYGDQNGCSEEGWVLNMC